MPAAALGTIFNLIPVSAPFLAPTERALTGRTDFAGQMWFLMDHVTVLKTEQTISLSVRENDVNLDGLRQFNHMFAVMLKFTNGVLDIIHCQVR